MRFQMEQMESLTELGYDGDFIENIEEGDEIAMLRWRYDQDGGIDFLRVEQVRLGDSPYWNEDGTKMMPHVLVRFIGIHENGVREPLTYGAGWEIFRKRR